MLDIIIPTYKNKEGLQKTLSSINSSLLNEINITIIDDYSEIYYNDIFKEFPFITIFYNLMNTGPGLAREYGMQMTKEPYIMFIDTGDTLINESVIPMILNVIKEHPDTVVFSWQYQIDGKTSSNTSNRLHGRIYKREFLNTYGIKFCPESSFTNEDIGFNRLCRIIIKDKELDTYVSTEPIIVYTKDENSLTNKNNGEFFFRQQNKGLALNSIHTVKIAKKNQVSENLLLDEVNTVMASLYYTFLCTLYERPEFINEAWDGARLYYIECFRHYLEHNTSELMAAAYSIYIKRIYLRAKCWKNFKPLNLMKFLKDLSNYEKLPSWYNV